MNRRTPSDAEANHPGTKLWVVGQEGNRCDHPTAALRELGSDGINGYYECSRCGAALVSQNEAFLGRAATSEE